MQLFCLVIFKCAHDCSPQIEINFQPNTQCRRLYSDESGCITTVGCFLYQSIRHSLQSCIGKSAPVISCNRLKVVWKDL